MSLENPQRLDELLNYRLSRLLALSSAPGIRLFEGGYGVSRREWRLVGLISEHGSMSPSDLAEVAHLERAHVSRAITELVSKGLMLRHSSHNDGRRARVELTSRGHELYRDIFPQVARLSQIVLSVLNESQLAAFEEALAALTKSAEALMLTTPVKVKASRHLGERHRVQQTPNS